MNVKQTSDNATPSGQNSAAPAKPGEQLSGNEGRHDGAFDSQALSAAPEELRRIGSACEEVPYWAKHKVIEQQTYLAYLPMVNRHTSPDRPFSLYCESNEDVWKQFNEERLYDTREVTLRHFHLFEWFPINPGRFHTKFAEQSRKEAYQRLIVTPEHRYYAPADKYALINEGVTHAACGTPPNENGTGLC